jgi:XTP/dITP diphosphohydrolase
MLATGNHNKLREFRSILAPHEVLLMPAGLELPPEGETSFEENARGKARALMAAMTGRAAAGQDPSAAAALAAQKDPGAALTAHDDPAAAAATYHDPGAALAAHDDPVDFFIADDSGLEVQGLDWAPGVTSARYAGEGASDEDNYRKLLLQLEGKGFPERRARFVCVVVGVAPDGHEVVARGEWSGTIGASPHGDGGFGYDPVFLPEGSDLTVAQLPQARKDQASHRALAGRALLELLEKESPHARGQEPAR